MAKMNFIYFHTEEFTNGYLYIRENYLIALFAIKYLYLQQWLLNLI